MAGHPPSSAAHLVRVDCRMRQNVGNASDTFSSSPWPRIARFGLAARTQTVAPPPPARQRPPRGIGRAERSAERSARTSSARWASRRDRRRRGGAIARARSGGGAGPPRRRLGGEPECREEPAHGVGLGHCAQDPPPAPAAVTHEHLKPEHPLEQPRPGPEALGKRAARPGISRDAVRRVRARMSRSAMLGFARRHRVIGSLRIERGQRAG
jgi:hypothetical protein